MIWFIVEAPDGTATYPAYECGDTVPWFKAKMRRRGWRVIAVIRPKP